MSAAPTLVLASTSVYRRELLQRLGLPFATARPDVDETPRPDETPLALAQRLAQAKAEDVAARTPGAWVLGSDQVAEFDGRQIGKRGHRAGALAQLGAM
ncbi:MAG: septum formation inhibitor Maf, partial [Lysobacter sp.]|nr:septum formation inhibitor Maf [Lysobacter sp.]